MDNQINLFVGPLGKAQLGAIKFAAGLEQSRLLLEVIEKLDTVEEMLKDEELSKTERIIAEKIKENLDKTFLNLAMTLEDADNGTFNEKQIF
tara:strand:+ start:11951 stop:12226 length:276 start_codon:yes stop_codon:yes gene_type:complete